MERAYSVIKRVAQLLIQVGVLAYIIYYIVSRRGQLVGLWEVGPTEIAAVLVLALLWNVLRSCELKTILSSLNTKVRFSECFHITCGTTLLNYLPMNAGTLLKARTLKRRWSVKYAHFVSVMGVTILITLLGGGILGMVAVLISGTIVRPEAIILTAVFLGSIVLPIAVLCLPSSLIGRRGGWIRTALWDMLDGWKQIRTNRRGILVLSVLSLTRVFIAALRLFICFRSTGTPISLVACVIFSVISNILNIFNITPGSLGVRELLIGVVAKQMQLSFESGIFAASLDRVFSLVVTICSGIPCLVIMRVKKMI